MTLLDQSSIGKLKRLAPAGSLTFRVDVKGDPYGHRFNIFPDGSIVDLAAEQFPAAVNIAYDTATPFTLLQSGGTQPSKRAQALNHFYDGGSEDTFQYRKSKGDWLTEKPHPKDDLVKSLGKWRDP